MKRLVHKFIIIAASIAATACSTTSAPSYNHLDAGARPLIKSVDTVLIARQDTVEADVKPGSQLAKILALTQASILPLAVDAGVTGIRTFTANKLAKPMREMLDGFDYPLEIREQMQQSLQNSALDGVEHIKLRRKNYDGFKGQYIQTSDADAVLFIDMRYAFTHTFDRLYLVTAATLFPNKDELRPFQAKPDNDNIIEFEDNIYFNQFAAEIKPDIKNAGKYANSIYWAGLTAEELTDKLQAAGLLMADLLADDISTDDVNSAALAADTDAADDNQRPNEIEASQEDVTAIKAQTDTIKTDKAVDDKAADTVATSDMALPKDKAAS